jgi:hypothetical protein
MSDLHSAHFIKIKYHGPTDTRGSRLSATWEGWPSDDGRPVRKSIAYTANRAEMAQKVGDLFAQWLTDGNTGLRFDIKRLTIAVMDGANWALLVETEARR